MDEHDQENGINELADDIAQVPVAEGTDRDIGDDRDGDDYEYDDSGIELDASSIGSYRSATHGDGIVSDLDDSDVDMDFSTKNNDNDRRDEQRGAELAAPAPPVVGGVVDERANQVITAHMQHKADYSQLSKSAQRYIRDRR